MLLNRAQTSVVAGVLTAFTVVSAGCTRSVYRPPVRVAGESADSSRVDLGSAVSAGDCVRVWVDTEHAATGQVLESDAVSLRFVPEAGPAPVEVPWRSVSYLERRTGTRGNEAAGTLVGAALGGIVGLFWSLSEWEPGYFGAPGKDPSEAYFLIPFITGATLGYFIGANDRTEVWEPVYVGDSEFDTRRTRPRAFWDVNGTP